MSTLRLILGDQLNENHSWFAKKDANIHYICIEAQSEVNYVRHHILKLATFFVAMRSFCKQMKGKGFVFHYITLDDKTYQGSLVSVLEAYLSQHSYEKFEYQLPDEYRVDVELKQLAKRLQKKGIAVKIFDSEHFYTTREEVGDFFGNKQPRMEFFYRSMRKKHGILLEDDGSPLGGEWNFDAKNRSKYDGKAPIPKRKERKTNIEDILSLFKNTKTMGRPAKTIPWPTTRKEALEDLDFFLENVLIHFGVYQDAMVSGEPILFHSLLSFALNVKLISPKEVVNAAIQTYYKKNGKITLHSLEGFVRQILGWREYVRGIYWAKMPEYQKLNAMGHKESMPDWYWTGDTKMNCLSQCINQSLDLSYAHHIQRLMIIGNFSLLLGIDPKEVDAWYLGVYVDAIEWVEITNTRGMSQFADGGILASKPYVSSANYIQGMSDYCKSCFYDAKSKEKENSCPFNVLYWDFFHRHSKFLAKNPRIGMAYNNWNRLAPKEKEMILKKATEYKRNKNSL